MAGKVWLVGAGPSDGGLLTLKGKAVLEQAEVVVFDALVGPEILAWIPPQAEKINVGKRAGCHLKSQEEINRILLEKALEGRRVVRLKGGDPFLFGRGGEELELLTACGVAYEVVPGVTSAVAVPAYCGIPVTHRDFCSSVHIITGHKRQGKPLELPFRALAETGGTLVFLMGLTALPEICQGLLEAGLPPETPAAVLEKGATAEQRTLVADLETLPRRTAEAGMQTPAIIVVGGVCACGEKLAWREKLPLFGCRAVVTRPRERAGTLAARLRTLGAEVLEVPAIETVALKEVPGWEAFLTQLEESSWLVFTSGRGVELFLEKLRASGRDIRTLHRARIAAIGPGTEAELRKYGLLAELIPQVFDGQHLGGALASRLRPGDRVWLPRAKQGGRELLEELEKVPGAVVRELPLYDTVYQPAGALDLSAEFQKHPETLVVFTSASTVRGFAAMAEGLDLTSVRAACIGPQTGAAARALGMEVHTAERATIDSLIQLVKQMHKGV